MTFCGHEEWLIREFVEHEYAYSIGEQPVLSDAFLELRERDCGAMMEAARTMSYPDKLAALFAAVALRRGIIVTAAGDTEANKVVVSLGKNTTIYSMRDAKLKIRELLMLRVDQPAPRALDRHALIQRANEWVRRLWGKP